MAAVVVVVVELRISIAMLFQKGGLLKIALIYRFGELFLLICGWVEQVL